MGDDDAAARREARRREREARRKEREAETTADDESARSRRRRKEEQQQEEEVKAERQRQEREREEAEAREKEERERERERRRREEQEAEERSRRRQEEEENDRRRRQKDEENDDEEEEKEDTIFETMSPQKKASILEGLAEEFRRIVEQREAKGQMVAVSAQELDELDLKVRSLRTQVRKAEENNNQLNKQKREIDEKLKKNENELNKLRNELQTAEAENELAIKEGKKVAPKLPTGPAKKKASPAGVAIPSHSLRDQDSLKYLHHSYASHFSSKSQKGVENDRPQRTHIVLSSEGDLDSLTLPTKYKGKQEGIKPVSSRSEHAQTSSMRTSRSPSTKKQSLEPASSRSEHAQTSSMRTSQSQGTKKQSLEPVSSRRTHSQISSKSKTEPPEVKPKPRWRSSSSSKINEPVQFKLQLSDVLSRDTVTSSQGMESRLRLKTKLQEQKETPKKPLDVKPKPWRAKFGEKELTFKDNILTFELKTKLRARSLLEKETVTITQEQEEYGDLDTSHTRQGNYRKFADHRLSVRRRKRHRPTSNPVRQLKKRKDIRSEF